MGPRTCQCGGSGELHSRGLFVMTPRTMAGDPDRETVEVPTFFLQRAFSVEIRTARQKKTAHSRFSDAKKTELSPPYRVRLCPGPRNVPPPTVSRSASAPSAPA